MEIWKRGERWGRPLKSQKERKQSVLVAVTRAESCKKKGEWKKEIHRGEEKSDPVGGTAGSYLMRNSYHKYPALPLQETHLHMLIWRALGQNQTDSLFGIWCLIYYYCRWWRSKSRARYWFAQILIPLLKETLYCLAFSSPCGYIHRMGKIILFAGLWDYFIPLFLIIHKHTKHSQYWKPLSVFTHHPSVYISI